MKVDQNQTQRNFPRITTGKKMDDQQYPPDEEDETDHKQQNDAVHTTGVDLTAGLGRFTYGWPSSRIVRVSRATGGKDRHSKVLTSKGLRDRRVRLSVNTAIQFYDLQDRLGVDQPSKAVEWLLKAAASSITELPPMNAIFPETPKLSDEKKSSNQNNNQNNNQPTGFESGDMDISSPSETTSKGSGSGLSLSRSETRVKARERAKERKKTESNLNPISQTTSFTELLSGGLNNNNNVDNNGPSVHENSTRTTNHSSFFLKSPRQQQQQWSSAPMDNNYFTSGLLGHHHHHHQQQSELQHFSFNQDNFTPAGVNNNNNLNFTISSSSNAADTNGLAGFNNNRGTLQSNSSMLPHLQRFPNSTTIDGSNSQSFFITPVENHHHHQFLSGFDAGRLQLYYGDAHVAGQKGKGNKN